jgi:putative membrane protein
MIKNFSDHAANERTFLAWVRTAIAVMAFGFLIERFDLFLQVAAPSLAGRACLHSVRNSPTRQA